VRGVTTDNLNQIVVTGGDDAMIRFWPFKSPGGWHVLHIMLL
jgi:hypothetical protein